MLESGSRISGYDVVELVGTGGMGRVYRARDTRLRRDVALKVLPDGFARDAERLARLEREARALAALNHPNVAAIYSIERAPDGVPFLVLEYVPGETLHGPRPVAEAIVIARQICDGLDAAHQHGIVHRDLKPANIKLTPDRRIKLLDFGLAKALAGTLTESSEALSAPTVTMAATEAGLVVGTTAYMSPEQARGLPVDNRTDIWGFGCVLYYLLVGRSPFQGESVQDTLAAVLSREPDWEALPTKIPDNIRRLLVRCLQKDPQQRLHHIADARLELEETVEKHDFQQPMRSKRSGLIPWIAAAAMAVIALAAWLWRTPANDAEQHVATLSLIAPEKYTFGSLTVSPDGRSLAFTTVKADGQSQLWVRPLHSASALPLAGTEGAVQPFWSTDSQALGFFASGKLKRIDVTGGPPQTLCEAGANPTGGAWNADGVIIFAPGASGPLYRIMARGGTPQVTTRNDSARGEEGHSSPHFLPDGKRFLYASRMWGARQDAYSVYAGSLDGGAPRQILTSASHPFYVAAHDGYLLFVRESLLLAQPFDAVRLETRDEPTAIGKIGFNFNAVGAGGGVWPFSVSNNGVLVFQPADTGFTQMMWFDRTGKRLGAVDHPDFRYNVFISPEGSRVAFERRDASGNYDIWVTDLSRGASSRLTNDPAPDGVPIWSPDGSRIVFFSTRTGLPQIHQMAAVGGGNAELLLQSKRPQIPSDWSSDGRFVIYGEDHPDTRTDIWLHPLSGGSEAVPLVRTPFNEDHGRLSPDGWIAYHSDQSGRNEVYVQPLPAALGGPGRDGLGRVQISTQGGIEARWRRDGRELYFLSPDGYMMAVDLRRGPHGLQAGEPHPLFPVLAIGNHRYDVTGDGQRFLVNVPAPASSSNPVTVMLNWTNALTTGTRSKDQFDRR